MFVLVNIHSLTEMVYAYVSKAVVVLTERSGAIRNKLIGI
jgi:hypothetical protein